MTGFDFAFALFSLLLGLAMAEVLGGFASVMKIHARARAGLGRDVRVGWLVPLMAVYVLLSQLTFWTSAFAIREQLPFNYVVLMAVTAVVGGYYLLSVLVWPDEPSSWPDFDAYYDQHNRIILSGNLLLTIVAATANNVYARPAAPVEETPVVIAAIIAVWLGLLLNLILIFVRRRWLNIGLLMLLIAMQVVGPVLLLQAGFKPAA